MKKYLNLVIFTLILLYSCTKEKKNPIEIETPKDSLQISLKSVSHTTIVLRLKTTANNSDCELALTRTSAGEEVPIIIMSLIQSDTTILDNNNNKGLKLNTEYSYRAKLINKNNRELLTESNIVIAKTKNAVGQEFSWEEYSVGGFWGGDMFDDIWGLDENNVYMSGKVTVDSVAWGVIKWNGSGFEYLSKIGKVGIYGFSENDIWSAYGTVEHYNGESWKRLDGYSKNHQGYPLDTIFWNNRGYHAIWGSNSKNVYFVGQSDNIVYWDGEKSHEMFGSKNINLTDIHGYDENFILTVGTGNLPSTALLYKGNGWEKVKGLDYNKLYYGCYVVSPNEYYITGGKVYRNYNNRWNVVVGDSLGLKKNINGDPETGELVVTGHVNTILHWNGVKWKNIGMTLPKPVARNNFIASYIKDNKIFVVGTDGPHAKLFIGTRKTE
ncbi:MAG: hypothetical protein JEY94_08260 [Melioribacteraceae bacterium]|nr:hypothetical protein [Melioribacteraceae bacterium]